MKPINKICSVALFVTLALTGVQCLASNSVNINITGKVIASPCTTAGDGTGNVNVSLTDTIQAADLSIANSGSTKIPFELALTGCPLGTENVTATFSGTADSDATLWKNTAMSPAVNTAVEVSDQTGGELISNGDTREAAVTDSKATFKLQARAVSTLGSVTPGDISTTILVAFTYQ